MTILRDLPAVIAVADELHFGQAAARLGMSQPQLSSIVKRVESRIGIRIFNRRPRVGLTREGQALVESARRALAEAEAGVARARALSEGSLGFVRLGFAPVAVLTPLTGALERFSRDSPDVVLKLFERHSGPLWEDLRADRLDLIVSREVAADPRASSVEIVREPLVAALPADHRTAKRRRVSLTDLRDETFLFWSRQAAPTYHDQVLAALRQAGVDPRIGQQVDSWSAILALVASHFGIALVSRSLSRIGFPGVEFRPIDGSPPHAAFWLSCYPDRLSPAAIRLREAIERDLSSRH